MDNRALQRHRLPLGTGRGRAREATGDPDVPPRLIVRQRGVDGWLQTLRRRQRSPVLTALFLLRFALRHCPRQSLQWGFDPAIGGQRERSATTEGCGHQGYDAATGLSRSEERRVGKECW